MVPRRFLVSDLLLFAPVHPEVQTTLQLCSPNQSCASFWAHSLASFYYSGSISVLHLVAEKREAVPMMNEGDSFLRLLDTARPPD